MRTALICALNVLVLLALPVRALAAQPAWTTYHHDDQRSGVADGTFTAHPTMAWKSPELDGSVYAEPLVLGSLVFVATESDSIYALDATTGQIVWHEHAGTPVPQSVLAPGGCAEDYPTVGITGTPVIDVARGEIFAVADTWDGKYAHYKLVGYSIANGKQLLKRTVDVPGSGGGVNPLMVPLTNLQREALTLDDGEVLIGFGSAGKDCDDYHGWLVASNEDGSGPLLTYMTPSTSKGGIWNSGGAPVVDSSGDIFLTTGNSESSNPAQYDEGNSIVELSPSLKVLSTFAPTDWAYDNQHDLDLGSANAISLPDGVLFQAGKNGDGYLISSAALGGIGGQLFSATLGPPAYPSGGGSFGGPAYENGNIYVPFQTGLFALHLAGLGTKTPSFTVLWHETTPKDGAGKPIVDGAGKPSAPNGPPIIAGGLVWSVFVDEDFSDHDPGPHSMLFGLDPATGKVSFSTPLPYAVHFTTPSAAGGRLFAAGNTYLYAFALTALPHISISSPSSGDTVKSPTVTVSGVATAADKGSVAEVYVNGVAAHLASHGRWTARIALTGRGQHTIDALVVEGDGASSDTSTTVTYSP